MFLKAMMFSCNVLNAIPLTCVSMNNQERLRPKMINVNSNEPSFYPCSCISMIHMQNYVFLMLLRT